jgi:hypothetical protein
VWRDWFEANKVQQQYDQPRVQSEACWERPGDGWLKFSSLVASIREILFVFSDFEVKFVRRQANMVAHSLARAVVSWASH